MGQYFFQTLVNFKSRDICSRFRQGLRQCPYAVTSTVLKIRRRKEPAVKVKDRNLFFRLVKMGFGQRRKVFTNAMKAGGIEAELGKKILAAADIEGSRRGETFSIEEYAALADAWYDLKE